MKRLLLALAFAIPTANAQVVTTTPTASPASQVLALAPQLLPFAGDANFANLVNGLARGLPVTLSTGLSNGGTQQFTFTPGGTMSALEIAQTLEKARQLLISHGVATPTAQQLGTALTGGSLTTASGTTTVNPIVVGATTGTTPAAQSPAAAIQANSPAANAAAGASAGVRNMSDSALPRGISDTPPQAVPGVTSPAPGSASTVTPAAAATPATPAAAATPATATPSTPTTAAPAAIRVR
ncbi:MAG TPA: hypothetical protein VNU64_15940 [Burkholderiales bacterium]|nr:hypothetical protein [Burkholderiales bacterium]